jgi:hypothetical protein
MVDGEERSDFAEAGIFSHLFVCFLSALARVARMLIGLATLQECILR